MGISRTMYNIVFAKKVIREDCTSSKDFYFGLDNDKDIL